METTAYIEFINQRSRWSKLPNGVANPRFSRTQRGAVMLVALIFLLLLTMLAMGASGNSLMQVRMAGGLRNAQQAQMSADTALRAAEWKLWMSANSASTQMHCDTAASGGCYSFDSAHPIANAVNFRSKAGWVTAGATAYQGAGTTGDYTTLANGRLAKNPLYIIEDLGPALAPGVNGSLHESGASGAGYVGTALHTYRITARGSGGNENTVRVVESTFTAKTN